MDYNELKERTESLTGVDIDELIERVRLLSIEYGTQKAMVDYLSDYRKAKLHSIVEIRRAEFDKKEEKAPSETKLESIARASEDYKDFLMKQYTEKITLVQTEADYYAARNKLESIMERIKLMRADYYLSGKN